MSDITLFECLEQCDLVCAVNSTLIYEALIYEKPVLQIGKSILSNKSIAYEVENLKDTRLINFWFHSDDFDVRMDKFKKFLSYMIDEELSFFSKGCLDLGFTGSDLLLKEIIKRVDENRSGSFPVKFLEGRIELEVKSGKLSAIQHHENSQFMINESVKFQNSKMLFSLLEKNTENTDKKDN